MKSARNPLAGVSQLSTPQSQPLPGRTQVRNDAGGYVFEKDLWVKVEDFLILGTTGGTFYTSDVKLTDRNVKFLNDALDADPARFVALVLAISASRPSRAVRPDPCLFALALADSRPAARPFVKTAFPEVVRTTDHLAKFFGYGKNLGGKTSKAGHGTSPVMNRSRRTMLASWFNDGDIHDVAFRALKARQRKTPAGEPMELRDIIRIAHVHPRTPEHRALIGWLAGRVSDADARGVLPDVDNFLRAQDAKSSAEIIGLVESKRIPWEFVPDRFRTAEVFDAMIDSFGMTALIRNLALMTRLGTLAPLASANARVVARLTNQDALVKARVHPMDLYLASQVYMSGTSQPDPKRPATTWSPVGVITDALGEAYELSFGAVEPLGARLLVAVDSSGSMSYGGSRYGWAYGGVQVNGSPAKGSIYEIANHMAAMTARIEGGNAHFIDVDTSVHSSKITPKSTFREIAGWTNSGGGTDLSLPFSWARSKNLHVDGFVVYTDNETWAGRSHPTQELEAYRRDINPAARVVVCSMTATGYQIADPKDEAVLAKAGLDSSLPKVISGFIRP
jgi:60 kDa SS-A/Ro ribonucleoprotein